MGPLRRPNLPLAAVARRAIPTGCCTPGRRSGSSARSTSGPRPFDALALSLRPGELLGELDWSQLDERASLERVIVAVT